MADIDTQPSPAATTTRSGTINLNINYVTSVSGVLKLCEILFGLIAWACVASVYYFHGSRSFFLFVSVTSWILTIVLFVIYLLALHASTCAGAPWSIIEFGFNSFWALFYFIASCVLAAHTYGVTVLQAATAFSFFTTIFYIVHAVVSFKEWRGFMPWAASSGANVNT